MEVFISGSLAAASSTIRLAFVVLNFFGLYRVFQKMGMPGWKGIIPFYNMYNLYDKVWESKHFWGYLLAQIVLGIPMGDASSLLVSLTDLALWVLLIVVELKLYIALAKAFGKGTGFGVLTFFFAPICLAILGFGSSEYNGAKKTGF